MKYLRFKLQQLGNIASDPRYIPFLFQRRFRSFPLRERIARFVAARRPQAKFLAANEGQVRLLGERGIAHLGTLLSPGQVEAVKRHFEQCMVADPYLPQNPAFLPRGNNRPASCHVAYHEPADILEAPHLLELANRPELLAVAEAFLGCKPTIGTLSAWWSYGTDEKALAAENFHRDVDDWRFLKLFVYLTDVGEQQGPHIYVASSAQSPKLTALRRFEDAEVEAAFGPSSILVNIGRAGEGFFENTFGVHKGQPVRDGHRLLFQVVYTITPLPYAPRRPLAKLTDFQQKISADLDPYINRLYLKLSKKHEQ